VKEALAKNTPTSFAKSQVDQKIKKKKFAHSSFHQQKTNKF